MAGLSRSIKTVTPNLLPRVSRRAILFLLAGLLSPSLARAFEQRNLYAHGSPGNAPSDAEAWLVYVESRSGKTDTSIVPDARQIRRERLEGDAFGARAGVRGGHAGWRTGDGPSIRPSACRAIGCGTPRATATARSSHRSSRRSPSRAIADRSGSSADPAPPRPNPPPPRPRPRPPSPSGPILYRLTKSQWEPQPAAWPADIDVTAQTPLSLALFNEKPTLAILAADGRVQLLQLENDAWALLDRLPVEGAPHHLKLLSIDQQPGIWYQAGDDAAGSIVTSHPILQARHRRPRPQARRHRRRRLRLADLRLLAIRGQERDAPRRAAIPLRRQSPGRAAGGAQGDRPALRMATCNGWSSPR